MTGDILSPPTLPRFDVVLCLNNTLSYISQPLAAISNMRTLGDHVIVSIFTEAYGLDEAKSYYETLGLSLGRMDDDAFVMADDWRIHRFTEADIVSWGGMKMATPLGWLVQLAT